MRHLILSLSFLLLLIPGLLLGAEMGTSAGHDLDQLWARAWQNHDLNTEDAILLLESREVTVGRDATLRTRVHRVVWVGTALGVRHHADLRIPWHSDHETLDVEILRTWREGRWWPDARMISDTAVVHTLPHALDRADDYTPMRETMLLHDGVELGCIMETAYTITRQGTRAAGDLFVFPRSEPAVLTRLTVQGPDLRHNELNGAPAPRTEGDTLIWETELTPALKLPVGATPELYEPAVAWSTWRTWQQAANEWLAAFASAGGLQPEQKEEILLRLYPGLGPRQKAAEMGAYLMEMVRPVPYDAGPWALHPRDAGRTLATAYGHALDRAVLAGALLDEAGIGFEPVLVGRGASLVAPQIPRLGEYPRVLLLLPDIFDALLDPATGKLVGSDATDGHSVWFLNRQARVLTDTATGGRLEVALDLEQAEDAWQVTGNVLATGRFSTYTPLLDGADLKEGYLSRLAGSLAPGLALDRVQPGQIRPEVVDLRFGGDGFTPAEDSRGRRALRVGAPAEGILAHLPADVRLHQETRQSPVTGIGGWEQTVTVRVEVAEEDLFQIPANHVVETLVGRFEVRSWHQDGRLTVARSLSLAPGPVPADQWPALRALLLEENDPRHGAIIWKAGE